MDFCFHAFISVSFLAVYSFLPKILRRVTKKMAAPLLFWHRMRQVTRHEIRGDNHSHQVLDLTHKYGRG
jgi:hypothetical protein